MHACVRACVCVCVLSVKRRGNHTCRSYGFSLCLSAVCSAAFSELCNCHGNRPISRPYGRPHRSQTDPVQSQRQKASRAPRVYNQLVINVLKLSNPLITERGRPELRLTSVLSQTAGA